MEAVRLWARGDIEDQGAFEARKARRREELEAQFGAFGLVPDYSKVDAQAEPPGDCYLWPECLSYWQAWLGVQTQWRTASGGLGGLVRTGLDYAGVDVHLVKRCRLKGRAYRETWGLLEKMETAALAAWSEKADGE
jgi:hypothetical protein